MKTVFISAIIAIIFSVILLKPSSKKPVVAELLVTNAFIYTSDPSLPFADSMAIKDGHILSIGNFSSLQAFEGPTTERLNLKGKVVVPGFVDAHLHLLSGGLQMARVKLYGVSTREEFIKKIEVEAKSKKEGAWVLGGGWSNNRWGGELPMTTWIDDITPHNPVWLSRMDGHMGFANSLALKLAGISRDTKDPAGGTIMRTADGEPTGLLIDAAMQLIHQFVPQPSIDERREALLTASSYALTKGVTTVVDLGRYFPGSSTELSWQDFTDIYSWAAKSGNMMIRVCVFFPIQTWSRLAELKKRTGDVVNQWLYLGGVKAYIDGSLGSNSALFYEPYVNDPETSGLQVMDLDSLTNMTIASDNSGLQVAIHAIGDRANDLILDMYESVAHTNGIKDRRFRIEHAQHLAPDSSVRFGKQGVVASVQVADLDPMNTLRAAVKRIPPTWEAPWIPSERVTFNDALDAHTISAAFACHLDKNIGSLSPGKLADFVVLSTNSWESLEQEAFASIEATYVGGIKAYSGKDVM
ncbi:protein LONG AFTER FAR-RED 3 isoform X2 [Silene latifolia]|uniref:protein LONG AFTER FAR-RED 3 isoform X2 n=1 Tax=Silene latifolia TaxID=37657 RepID=UPI003D76AF6F